MSLVPPLQQQQQIIREIGDPNGTITPIIATLWSLAANRGQVDPRLVALYAKRAALDIRSAEEQPSTDVVLGQDIADRQSARFDHILSMRAACQAEIVRIEGIARGSRPPAVGTLTASEPQPPTDLSSPDPNDPRYRGSAYTPLEPRW